MSLFIAMTGWYLGVSETGKEKSEVVVFFLVEGGELGSALPVLEVLGDLPVECVQEVLHLAGLPAQLLEPVGRLCGFRNPVDSNHVLPLVSGEYRAKRTCWQGD